MIGGAVIIRLIDGTDKPRVRPRPGAAAAAAQKVASQHGRQSLVRHRVALNKRLRGILLEYGISLPVGARVVSQQAPALLEDAGQALPPLTRHLLAEPKAEHAQRVSRVEALETQLKHRRQLSGM